MRARVFNFKTAIDEKMKHRVDSWKKDHYKRSLLHLKSYKRASAVRPCCVHRKREPLSPGSSHPPPLSLFASSLTVLIIRLVSFHHFPFPHHFRLL